MNFADVIAEANSKLANGELQMPKIPPGMEVDDGPASAQQAVAQQPPTPSPPPAPQNPPPVVQARPNPPPPQPEAQPQLAENPAQVVEQNAAARLQRERDAFTAEQRQFEAQRQDFQRQQQEFMAQIRQAQDVMQWRDQMQQLAKADPVGFMKQQLGFSDDDILRTSMDGWTRVEGENAPQQARDNVAAIQNRSELAQLRQQVQQMNIQLREYQYLQGIHQASSGIIDRFEHAKSMRSNDPSGYEREMHRSANELAQQHRRMPTADEILQHTETRLAQQRAYWNRIGPPSSAPPAPAGQNPIQPQQNVATQAPAAQTNGLSASPPQRGTAPDLSEDPRTRWRQAMAEGQARLGMGSG